ncbi:ankyrin repeat domain-containing protein [Legionella sainthelensi]|uniref:ankyrin repeat domain-containing protein n=1 Tax=Legionella sainthelensi TaxID=28087 RepID=UPI000E2073CB|nr:ankyrin repeat domain-containing protein [Legionella sainthelensi]
MINELKKLLEEFNSDIDNENKKHPFTQKKMLIQKHSKEVYEIFYSLLNTSENDKEISHESIKNTFVLIWNRVQGTTLSYTALPEAAVTKFLIKVACKLLKEDDKDSYSLVEIIQLLMPTLLFGENPEIYKPAAWGFNSGSASRISAIAFQDENDKEADVIKFLKTHIISDCGTYIIPLWVLNVLEKKDKDEPIPNYYYEPGATDNEWLSDSEFVRLGKHNLLTKSIVESYGRMQEYKQDKTNLLGQLNILLNSLHYNSVSGVGKEEIAGATAELSIRRFFEYYNVLCEKISFSLDDKLKHELGMLRKCIGEYSSGEAPIALIQTCMAARKSSLQKTMMGKESYLAGIGLGKNEISEVIENTKKKLQISLDELNQAIETGSVNGCDHLPLTRKILDIYGFNLHGCRFEELIDIINDLSEEDIRILLDDFSYVKSWSYTIGTLDNIIKLFRELTPVKIDVLCGYMAGRLNKILNKKEDYYFLISSFLDPNVQEVIVRNFVNKENVLNNVGSEKGLMEMLVQSTQAFDVVWRQFTQSEKIQILNTKNSDSGNTLLHDSINNANTLKLILKFLADNDMINTFIVLNLNKNNLLHCAASNAESLKMLLQCLPQKDHLNAIKAQNRDQDTVLHLAMSDVESLKILLEFIPSPSLLELIKIENRRSETPISIACKKTENFKIILAKLSEKDRMELINPFIREDKKNIFKTYLNDNPDKIQLLLNLFPPNERINIVTTQFEDGQTLFDLCAQDFDALKFLLQELPKNERLRVLTLQTKYSLSTIFHRVINSPPKLQILFDALTEQEYLKVLEIKNKYSFSLVEYALTHHLDSFKYIVERTPKDHLLRIIENINAEHFNSLDEVTFRVLGDLYLSSDRSDCNFLSAIDITKFPQLAELKNRLVVESKNRQELKFLPRGNDCLLRVASIPETLTKILRYLPEKDHLERMKAKDKKGNTVLHLAMSNTESLKIILKFIPKNLLLELIKIQNMEYETPISLACQNSENVDIILAHLSENERMELMSPIDRKNEKNIFKIYLSDNPDKIQSLLNLFPPNKRSDIVATQFEDGQTPFHLCAQAPDALRYLLQQLPKNERLRVLTLQTKYSCSTVFHMALGSNDALKILFEELTEQEYLKVLRMGDKYSGSLVECALKSRLNLRSFKYIVEHTPKDHLLRIIERIKSESFNSLDEVTFRLLGDLFLSSDRSAPNFVSAINVQKFPQLAELKNRLESKVNPQPQFGVS